MTPELIAGPLVGMFRFNLTCENMYLGTGHHLCFYQISSRSDFKYGCLAAILENQLRAIDMQLCTYVALGNSKSETKFRSSLMLSLAKTEENFFLYT
jgi:hypothetical protein